MKTLLKQKRADKGYTQADMARHLDCTENYYHQIESGRRRPSPERSKLIGKLLDIDWTTFYDDNKNNG